MLCYRPLTFRRSSMHVSLEEVKQYTRIDSTYDDDLLLTLITTSQSLCENILRVDLDDDIQISEMVRTAILYGVSYLYENRETADFKELTTMLKYLLYGEREEVF